MGSQAVWVLSLVVLAGTCGLSLAGGDQDGQNQNEPAECIITTTGTMNTFGGESARMTLPCKYRLADFTCSHYHVKVTPGNAVDLDEKNVVLSTLWVKVTDTNSGEYVAVHTSMKRLGKYHGDQVDNPWKVKKGNASLLSDLGYDDDRLRVYLGVKDTFEVFYDDKNKYVNVVCYQNQEVQFESSPTSLCGDGKMSTLEMAAKDMFPGDGLASMSKDYYLHYLVMNHDSVVQSEFCTTMADKFHQCKEMEKTTFVKACHGIFGDMSTSSGLTPSPEGLRGSYLECMASYC